MNQLTLRLFSAVRHLKAAPSAVEARHCKIEIADALLALIGFDESPTLWAETPKALAKPKYPTLPEVRAFCTANGVSQKDADWFWYKMDGCGWKNGARPVKQWTSTIIAWKAAGHLPSQKAMSVGNNRTMLQSPNEISRDLNRLANEIKREERI